MDRAIFADSSFWIALRNERDACHARARQIATRLLGERWLFVVTSMVFAETHAFFVRSLPLRRRVIRDFWENPVVEFEDVTRKDQKTALDLLVKHEDKTYSFCDACSFAVIARTGLTRAVSFDEHFRQVNAFQVVD